MLQGLDWNTWPTKIRIATHWRLLTCVLTGFIIATLIWHTLFPHTLGFNKIWGGFATGATAGMLPGTKWQLYSDTRRAETSGWFVVVGVCFWGLLACISLFQLAPQLYAQEQELAMIRSLAAADISGISVKLSDQRLQRIEDAETISQLVRCTKRARLFYPSHESSTRRFEITIVCVNGKRLRYKGRVPERHMDDFSLRFRGCGIIIPGGRRWLDALDSKITN